MPSTYAEDPDNVARGRHIGDKQGRCARGVKRGERHDIAQTGVGNSNNVRRSMMECVQAFHHASILLAHKTSLRMLVEHLSSLPSLPRHLDLLKKASSSLAVDALAFSACLRNGSPSDAVKLLEQGRGVFWNQLNRLRLPLDVIVAGPAGEVGREVFTVDYGHS